MKLRATGQMTIARPVSTVFEAWVNPKVMSKYFISSGSERLEKGNRVTWKWDDVNARCDVDVKRVEKNRRLTFTWGAAGGPDTTVDVKFEKAGRRTQVKVTEGWITGRNAIARLAEQTGGWMHMLLCLKAWLEHGVRLR